MKITSPFKHKKEVLPLIEAGADELYCGYISPQWVRKYTAFEFERKGGGSNFTDLEELKKAVDLAHRRNIPVYLTLNGLYVKQQYPFLLKIIHSLDKVDLDGYIIADIGLLLTLRQQNFRKQIHISTGGTVFNSESCWFYENLGATRIILDRQTTLKSMKVISGDNPNMDFEAFILNTLCVYIDGFCTFLHTYGRETRDCISMHGLKENEKLHIISIYDPEAQGDACCLKYSVRTYNMRGESSRQVRPTFFKHFVDGPECGICALFDISKTKVKSVKIVGRQYDSDFRLKSVKFVRAALDILKNYSEINKRGFIERAQKLYREVWGYAGNCKGNNCYYPDALLGKE